MPFFVTLNLCIFNYINNSLVNFRSNFLVAFFAILRCKASGLLPGGDGDGWRYVPAVCATGDGDSSHRIAQGMCTRIVLALAGRDTVNFWRRPVAALSTRTFIMSSPARRRGSARRGQPLTTARSEDGPSSIRPFCHGLFHGLPKGAVLVWCSAFF